MNTAFDAERDYARALHEEASEQRDRLEHRLIVLHGSQLELLAALEQLHPKPGIWRTPTDAEAKLIEAVINKAKTLEGGTE